MFGYQRTQLLIVAILTATTISEGLAGVSIEPVWREYIRNYSSVDFGLERFSECLEVHFCNSSIAQVTYNAALLLFNRADDTLPPGRRGKCMLSSQRKPAP